MQKALTGLGAIALGALTVGSAFINATGFLTIVGAVGMLLCIAAFASEVLGVVFAAKAASEDAGKATRTGLALCCVAFNLIAGHHAIGHVDLGFGAGVPHRAAADVAEDLKAAQAKLEGLNTLDMSDAVAVKAAQTALARAGYYTGTLDGLPGTATSTAIGAAVADLDGRIVDGVDAPGLIDALEDELKASRSADFADLLQLVASLVIVVVFEVLKSGGAFALGLHGERKKAADARAVLAALEEQLAATQKTKKDVRVKGPGRGANPDRPYTRKRPGAYARLDAAKAAG